MAKPARHRPRSRLSQSLRSIACPPRSKPISIRIDRCGLPRISNEELNDNPDRLRPRGRLMFVWFRPGRHQIRRYGGGVAGYHARFGHRRPRDRHRSARCERAHGTAESCRLSRAGPKAEEGSSTFGVREATVRFSVVKLERMLTKRRLRAPVCRFPRAETQRTLRLHNTAAAAQKSQSPWASAKLGRGWKPSFKSYVLTI